MDQLDRTITEALRAWRVQHAAGVDPARALETAAAMVPDMDARRAFVSASGAAARGEGFEALVAALRSVCTHAERAVLMAGFQSGRLEECLDDVIQQRELWEAARRQLRAGMALPLMVLLLAAFVAPLPAFVSGGSVMGYMAAVLLPLIVALAVWQAGARMFASRVEGGVWHEVLDLLLLQTPVVRGVERERNLGDFASLLGLQLAAGVPINRALETCARCLPNGHYRAAVTEALNQVQNGRPLSKTLGSELFPQEFVATVAVGEQAGALDASLKRYAAQARENYARAVQGLTAWLQRGLYVVVALFVLFNIARLALTVFAGYGSVVR